jgi:hypothetical protein
VAVEFFFVVVGTFLLVHHRGDDELEETSDFVLDLKVLTRGFEKVIASSGGFLDGGVEEGANSRTFRSAGHVEI